MKRLSTFLLLSMGFVLSACQTTTLQDERRITSIPDNAFVRIETTNQECTTPCTITLEKPLKISVSKEGYETQIFYIEQGKGEIIVELKYIAGSEQVDATKLPDL